MEVKLLSTPIGNINDVSKRLTDCLREETLFFVEDTRQFKKLCDHLDISLDKKKIFVFNDHKQDLVDEYVQLIEENTHACLVSDAGSPVLSDPAFPLVKKVIEKKGRVFSIPGASAVTMAIELCGFPPHPYTFMGFLPRNKSDLTKKITHLREGHTYCFFEAPHRIESSLSIWEKNFPFDEIFVGRELTKKFESHYRFVAGEYSNEKHKYTWKGEIVLVVHPRQRIYEATTNTKELEDLAKIYLDSKTPKKLSKLLAKVLNKDARDIYDHLVSK